MINAQSQVAQSQVAPLRSERASLAPIYRQIEHQAQQLAEKVALRCGEQILTYAELNGQANRLARYLQAQGAGPNLLIALALDRKPLMMVALLAILKTGAAYLPLDLAYPSDRIQYILDNAQAPLLLTQSEHQASLGSSGARPIALDQLEADLAGYSSENLAHRACGDDLAYVIYTSGSTGQPKGVQISHLGLSNLMQSMAQVPGLTPADVTLTLTTIAFDMSVPELFLGLSVGATLELVGRDVASDGHRLRAILERGGITWMQGTPSTWRMLLAAGWQGSPGLKILIGGEATSRELADQLLPRCAELWNMYGPTETTVWSMAGRIQADDQPIRLNNPLDNTQIYLMEQLANGELYPVLPGEPGEICIGGWGVAQGYLNRPELTAAKFVTDLNSRDLNAKLYRTGDLAQECADGSLQFLGRMDHQVKIRGHRVELGAVEAALLKHPQIANAAVIATQDLSQSQQLVGYLVAKTTPEAAAPVPDAEPVQAGAPDPQAWVQSWKALWDDAYRHSAPGTDPTFDFSGYRNSYTGDLLPASAIQEWTEQTVERILALQPRRVLEVGCGKGLLLFRVAPRCDRYVAIDVTPGAIAHLQQTLDCSPEDWSQVSLACAAADQLASLAALGDETFDTIVINSVIQYFPDLDYLLQVFDQLIDRLQPGGRIFLGDVRNLDLLETFHSTVLLQRYQAGLSHCAEHLPSRVADFKYLLAQQSQQDPELLLKPDFFAHLQQRCPRIAQVVSQLKRGHQRNELIDFRADLVLYLDDGQDSLVQPVWQDGSDLSLAQIEAHLVTEQPDCWGLRGLVNARLLPGQRLIEQLGRAPDDAPVLPLLAQGGQPGWAQTATAAIDPEALWHLGDRHAYQVHIRWGSSPDRVDVVFQRRAGTEAMGQNHNWADPRLAETWSTAMPFADCFHLPWQAPARPATGPSLSNRALRTFLAQHLPSYMVPSQFVLLDQLPLTPNHKVDRKALPPLEAATSLRDDGDYVAPATELERQLASLWEELLQIAPLGKTAHFFDCGGHSLLATQLITCIRDRFGVELSLAVLFQAPLLADLAGAIALAQGGATQPNDSLEQQIATDCQLDPAIGNRAGLAAPSALLQRVLLTGATGFVGGFLLQELLSQTSAKVYCLVRSPNAAEAQRKLENHLERCQVPWERYRDRIVALPGDLAQPRLGLTPEQYQTLAEQLDTIYHNGAYVNLIYPYAELRAANVTSTVEILRLASQIRLKPVHYVSTLDVLHGSELSPQQQLTEEQPLPPSHSLSSDYARTKWVAEQLIQAARQRGIPCNIYRLGMTTGHSCHGFSNPNDMIGRLIRGLIALGSAPRQSFRLNLAPVDSVCQAIIRLSQPRPGQGGAHPASQPSSLWGHTFHVSNPRAVTLRDLVQCLRSRGYNLAELDYETWFQQLMACQDNALKPLLDEFGHGAGEQNHDFFKVLDLSQVRRDQVQAALPQFCWPDLREAVLERYLDYLIDSGVLEPPVADGAVSPQLLHPDIQSSPWAESNSPIL